MAAHIDIIYSHEWKSWGAILDDQSGELKGDWFHNREDAIRHGQYLIIVGYASSMKIHRKKDCM